MDLTSLTARLFGVEAADTLHCLIVDSEPMDARDARRRQTGRTSSDIFSAVLRDVARVTTAVVTPSDDGSTVPPVGDLAGYDAVFFTGSPLHMYEETPATRRNVELMRAVFASGTPAFGSCAGLHIAAVAAGGSVRPNPKGREIGFARRIVPTFVGRGHPLLSGRPDSFDAATVHDDEIETLPQAAVALAGNGMTEVQAAEIRCGVGVFWGVQYHPELSLSDLAASLLREGKALVKAGYARSEEELAVRAADLVALDKAPDRHDLLWAWGLDAQVTDAARRAREIRNFIEHLARPVKSARGRA